MSENGSPIVPEGSMRPYKFIVQAVVQEIDAEDNVITEHPTEPIQLFGCAQLEKYANEFEENLKFAKRKVPQG
jgi:hypothetical protein